jgi:hypothetical protein
MLWGVARRHARASNNSGHVRRAGWQKHHTSQPGTPIKPSLVACDESREDEGSNGSACSIRIEHYLHLFGLDGLCGKDFELEVCRGRAADNQPRDDHQDFEHSLASNTSSRDSTEQVLARQQRVKRRLAS